MNDKIIAVIVITFMLGIGYLMISEINQQYCLSDCIKESNVSVTVLNQICLPAGSGCSPNPVHGTEKQYQEFKSCVVDRCNGSMDGFVYKGRQWQPMDNHKL